MICCISSIVLNEIQPRLKEMNPDFMKPTFTRIHYSLSIHVKELICVKLYSYIVQVTVVKKLIEYSNSMSALHYLD